MGSKVDTLEKQLEQLRAIQHEIRNVAMGLIGNAELLGQYPDLSPQSREKVELIREQSLRLIREIEGLSRVFDEDD